MARTPKVYEYANPAIGKISEGYDNQAAAKMIFEREREGWEFLQIYVVSDPVNDYMGKIQRSTVYALFRREKE
jgi:hypothetical protein